MEKEIKVMTRKESRENGKYSKMFETSEAIREFAKSGSADKLNKLNKSDRDFLIDLFGDLFD